MPNQYCENPNRLLKICWGYLFVFCGSNLFIRRGDRRASTADRPRAFDERPYKTISNFLMRTDLSQVLFSWPRSTKMQFNKSRRRRVWNQGISLVWNHHEVMYGINPKERYTLRVMPYRRKATDSMHRTSRGDSIPILRIG